MHSSFQKTLIGVAVAGTTLIGAQAQALGLSGNVGVASNYIWRGVSQTDDQAAISGGLDLSTDMGIYLGTWISNVDFSGTSQVRDVDGNVVTAKGDDKGYEMDLYGGYAGEWDKLGYDVGVILYAYPTQDSSDDQLNFSEVYVGGSYALSDALSIGANVAYTYWARANDGDDNWYYSANLDYALPIFNGIDTSVYIGRYDFDNSSFADSYVHWGASVGKSTDYGDFAIAYDQTDEDSGLDSDADNPRFTASWTMAVDF